MNFDKLWFSMLNCDEIYRFCFYIGLFWSLPSEEAAKTHSSKKIELNPSVNHVPTWPINLLAN
jgi:hypothetical protein